jgi:hypothetical protein
MPDRTENPMRSVPDWRVTMPLAHGAPRCGAKTRAGGSCQQPAMSNHRCRLHGGYSTGPRTIEGLERLRQARTIHGRRSAWTSKMRAEVRAMLKEARRLAVLV